MQQITAKPKASRESQSTNTLDFESGNNVALQASSLDELVDNGRQIYSNVTTVVR